MSQKIELNAILCRFIKRNKIIQQKKTKLCCMDGIISSGKYAAGSETNAIPFSLEKPLFINFTE